MNNQVKDVAVSIRLPAPYRTDVFKNVTARHGATPLMIEETDNHYTYAIRQLAQGATQCPPNQPSPRTEYEDVLQAETRVNIFGGVTVPIDHNGGTLDVYVSINQFNEYSRACDLIEAVHLTIAGMWDSIVASHDHAKAKAQPQRAPQPKPQPRDAHGLPPQPTSDDLDAHFPESTKASQQQAQQREQSAVVASGEAIEFPSNKEERASFEVANVGQIIDVKISGYQTVMNQWGSQELQFYPTYNGGQSSQYVAYSLTAKMNDYTPPKVFALADILKDTVGLGERVDVVGTARYKINKGKNGKYYWNVLSVEAQPINQDMNDVAF